MNKIVCIYVILNDVDGKLYIGQTVNFKERKKNHLVSLRSGTHSNEHLQRAFNKFGEEHFTIKILQECKENELDDLERFYIAKYDSTNKKKGYNILEGGERPGYRKHNAETKKKMSLAGKGRKFSEAHKKNIGLANKGKKMSKEAIEKTRRTKQERHSQHGEKNPMAIVSNQTAKDIILSLLRGEKIKEIALNFNCSTNVVYNILHNKTYKDVLPEKRKELSNRVKDSFDKRLMNAVEAYKFGMSQNEAAKLYKVSRNSLREKLKELKINTRLHIN